MGTAYYSVLARLQLMARPVRRLLRSVPLPHRAADNAGSRIRRLLLPTGHRRWVKVESGHARGLWLCLDLLSEGGFWLGTYEREVQDFLSHTASPGRVAYDVGAYLGFFSLLLARRAGPEGIVVAFEPVAENAVRVQENAKRNGFRDRVRVVRAAAWSHDSPAGVRFRLGGRQRTYGGVLADGSTPVLAQGETVLVPVVTLDGFIRDGNPVPQIVKMDVEGGECEVLKGADELFSRSQPALVCEVHHIEAARWIERWLERKGYTACWLIPPELFPRMLFAQAGGPPALPSPAHQQDAEEEA